MADAVWLGEVLRAAELRVAEVDGWRDRRRPGSPSTLSPAGIVGHHTAGPTGGGNMPSLGVLVRGRRDLSGPLCNVGLGRDGTYYVVAAGPANHAGPGGWDGLSGNYRVIGIEAENDGHEPWPEAQLDAYAHGSAAILTHLGQPAKRWCRHHEWRAEKPDPHDIDGPAFRARIAAIMAGSVPPPGPPPPPSPIIRQHPGDHMHSFQTSVKFGADGRGFFEFDGDASKVLYPVPQGWAPGIDEPWPLPSFGKQQRGPKVEITADGGRPHGGILVDVYVLD